MPASWLEIVEQLCQRQCRTDRGQKQRRAGAAVDNGADVFLADGLGRVRTEHPAIRGQSDERAWAHAKVVRGDAEP